MLRSRGRSLSTQYSISDKHGQREAKHQRDESRTDSELEAEYCDDQR